MITIMIITIMVCSCQKALDLKPMDFLTPETFFNKESDATLALNGAFDMLSKINFYGGAFQIRMLCADDVYMTLTGAYPGNNKSLATDGMFSAMWNNIFTTIERTNILLANLPRVTMDENKRGIIKGEALFLRAYCMFLLVDMWGPVPIKIKPTSGANDVIQTRMPIKDVYAQILKDMTEAESLVPTTATSGYGGAGYPAKTTVQGILARVCLTMAGEPLKDVSKFQDAKDWATKVVQSGQHTLNPDYTNIFIKLASDQYDPKESMWEVDFILLSGFSGESGQIGYLNGIPGAAQSFGAASGQARTTRVLYNLYGATTNDTRRDWNCAPFTYVTNTTTGAKTFFTSSQIYDRWDGKWRPECQTYATKVSSQTGINFPLLRYSDVMLMLAEAENELNGPTTLAYSMINQVRARAYGKLMPGAINLTEANLPANLDKTSFLKEIQDERAMELCSEAIRKHDLIRWGIYLSALKAVKADANNTSLPAVNSSLKALVTSISDLATNKDVLWPIPSYEISLNSGMTQNEGW